MAPTGGVTYPTQTGTEGTEVYDWAVTVTLVRSMVPVLLVKSVMFAFCVQTAVLSLLLLSPQDASRDIAVIRTTHLSDVDFMVSASLVNKRKK